MTGPVASSVTQADVEAARDRAEAWLARTEITSLLMYADRLLLRVGVPDSPGRDEDLEHLVARREEALAAIDEDLKADVDDTISVLVIRWAWLALGLADVVARLDVMLDGYMHQLPNLADAWPEPERSTYYFWAARAGRATPRSPGPRPDDVERGIYRDLHLLMFESDYGAHALAPAALDDVLVDALDYPPRLARARGHRENADLIAEALVVELALTPRRTTLVDELIVALVRAQHVDGSFTPAPFAPRDARHHATCVAVAALSRLASGGA